MSKRQAGVQITKEREGEDEDWGRDGPPDPAETASADVLATRKIALPRSRRKPAAEAKEEAKSTNPFSFMASSNNETTNKSNPFANLVPASTVETPKPSSASRSLEASTTPIFSFGKYTAQSARPEEKTTTSSTSSTEQAVEKPSSSDSEFDALLRGRSLNICFLDAIKISLQNDPFADLTIISKEYVSHKDTMTKVPVVPAKSQNGTGIYPSFTNTTKSQSPEKDTSQSDQTESEQPEQATGPSATTAAGLSLNASAPVFNFQAPAESKTGSAFKFGLTSEEPATTTIPEASFSFKSPAKPESKENEEKSPIAPSSSSAEKAGNDFSWTPDRGIKFGDSSTSTGKPTAPVFGFNNPLTSPTQRSTEPNADPKPASMGFSFGQSAANTGFSFGQASSSAETKKDSAFSVSTSKPAFSFGQSAGSSNTTQSDTSATTSKPAFSFGSAAPTFSFGASSTPTFSFSAPKKATEELSTKATDGGNEEKADVEEDDGDAMPEEPRTNDALIAGPAAGEEDEDEVYAIPRAKLFKYKSDVTGGAFPWSDLGVCIIRVLVHKETKKARILARAEGAGAVRLNARLYPHLKYTHEGKANVKLFDLVSATQTSTYLIKTKEKDVSMKLVEVLNDNKK